MEPSPLDGPVRVSVWLAVVAAAFSNPVRRKENNYLAVMNENYEINKDN